MRDFLIISERLNHDTLLIRDIVDPDIRKACCRTFNDMAEQQRGHPEDMGGGCMLNPNLFPNGTGLYTHATEHVGDLTNRMAANWATGEEGEGNFGYQFVVQKIRRAMRYLNSPYGFEREIREQVERNYNYFSREKKDAGSLKDWWADLEEAGIRYAEVHAKLPVYNEAQWVARQAAINLGNMDYTQYGVCLTQLQNSLDTEMKWIDYASRVQIDSSGKPAQFHG